MSDGAYTDDQEVEGAHRKKSRQMERVPNAVARILAILRWVSVAECYSAKAMLCMSVFGDC